MTLWPTTAHDLEYRSSAMIIYATPHRSAARSFHCMVLTISIWQRCSEEVSTHFIFVSAWNKCRSMTGVIGQAVPCGTCLCSHDSLCARTLSARRVLRAHGMDEDVLQSVCRTVVIAKLTYAPSAWWGLGTTAFSATPGIYQCRWPAATARIHSPKWPQSFCSTRSAEDCGFTPISWWEVIPWSYC